MLKAAVIGCGGIGALHAKAYQRCPNVRLAAVVDTNRSLADSLASAHRVKALYSLDGALSDPEIDIIDVAASTRAHAVIVMAAGHAGKHCICEKPFALSREDYYNMDLAFKSSGKVLGGIFQHRFMNRVQEASENIQRSNLGRVLLATSATNWWRDTNYWQVPGRSTYEEAGGGVLMVQAIHAIDLVIYLLGEPVSVSAVIAKGGGLPSSVKVEHTGAATILFKSGAAAAITGTIRAWSSMYPSPGSAFDHMQAIADEKHLVTVTGEKGSISLETPQEDIIDLFARNLDDFARSILDKRPPVVSGESAMRTVRVILAMYESAEQQTVVKL